MDQEQKDKNFFLRDLCSFSPFQEKGNNPHPSPTLALLFSFFLFLKKRILPTAHIVDPNVLPSVNTIRARLFKGKNNLLKRREGRFAYKERGGIRPRGRE